MASSKLPQEADICPHLSLMLASSKRLTERGHMMFAYSLVSSWPHPLTQFQLIRDRGGASNEEAKMRLRLRNPSEPIRVCPHLSLFWKWPR